MKKLLLAVIILTIATLTFAYNPKNFYQQILITGQDALTYVNTTGTVHDADWHLSVKELATGEIITTTTKPATQIRVFTIAGPPSGAIMACAYFNVQAFSTTGAIPVGRVFELTITYLPNANAETNHATTNLTYAVSAASVWKTGTDAWTLPATILGETDTWNYNLQFTVPAGEYTINGIGAPYLFTDHDDLEPNTLIGNYTISAAPAGFHWVENPIAVAAGDFILAGKANNVYNASKSFQLAENVANIATPPAEGVTVVGNGANGLPVGVSVTGGGVSGLPGVDTGFAAVVMQISAVGIWDFTVYKPAAYAADRDWFIYINNIHPGTRVPAAQASYTFENYDFGAKAPIVVTLDDNMSLPVEFSSFAATLTAQNFVKLTWVTETETGVSGYNVYRSEDADQASAVKINGTLIDATNTSSTQTYNHVDNAVSPETTYSYWLEVVEMDGTTSFHGPTTVYVETPASIVPSLVTTMGNAYPNPFKANSSTNIAYEVKAGETGTITIYNIIGQVVKTVPVKETTAPATFTWNGRDSKGNVCASGIYFYKMSTPSRNVTKKMVIVN